MLAYCTTDKQSDVFRMAHARFNDRMALRLNMHDGKEA